MNCNILLLGQTGVGKSSLLNYIAGKELAEAGISSHIGGITRGINKYSVDINGRNGIILSYSASEQTAVECKILNLKFLIELLIPDMGR